MLDDEHKAKFDSGEETHEPITDVYEASQDFLDYMVFSWMKAMDERSLSACRSIAKLAAWMRVLNRPDVAEALTDSDSYGEYGRPASRRACEMLGIDAPADL